MPPVHDTTAHHRALAAFGAQFDRLTASDCGFGAWNAGNALARYPGVGGVPVFFHVTDSEESFNLFCLSDEASLGFHFGTLFAAEHRRQSIYRMDAPADRAGTILPVLARAANPVRLPDAHDWQMNRLADLLAAAGLADDDEADWLIDHGEEDAAALFALLEAKGHDAILYTNENEGATHVFDGRRRCVVFPEGEANLSLMVWRAEQVKSPFSARFDRADPCLLSQCPAAPEELDRWQQLRQRIATFSALLPAPSLTP